MVSVSFFEISGGGGVLLEKNCTTFVSGGGGGRVGRGKGWGGNYVRDDIKHSLSEY